MSTTLNYILYYLY